MSVHENKEFINRYLGALSGKPKPADIVKQYVDDAVLAHHIELFEAAFPSYALIAEEMISEGEKVAVRATMHGTHRGNFNGIAATGKEVKISVMLVYHIRNDKIVEHWMNADSLGLLQQLGVLPIPA
jgi:predicted ester cyclase